MNALRAALAAMAVWALAGCGGPGASGPREEWIRGKRLSARVRILMPNAKQSSQAPEVEIRNDSAVEFTVTPVRMTGWWDHSGQREAEFTLTENGRPARLEPHEELLVPSTLWVAGLESETVDVRSGRQTRREIRLEPIRVRVPGPEDTFRKLELEIGPAADPESFTVSR